MTNHNVDDENIDLALNVPGTRDLVRIVGEELRKAGSKRRVSRGFLSLVTFLGLADIVEDTVKGGGLSQMNLQSTSTEFEYYLSSKMSVCAQGGDL